MKIYYRKKLEAPICVYFTREELDIMFGRYVGWTRLVVEMRTKLREAKERGKFE